MRPLLLPLTLLLLTGAGAGYGDIDAPRDTTPLALGERFCAARLGDGDMSALAPWFAPKLEAVLQRFAADDIPWQSRPQRPENCAPSVMFGQDDIIGVLVELHYRGGGETWTDTLNFQRTPTSWLLNNVFFHGGGNLRFQLFERPAP